VKLVIGPRSFVLSRPFAPVWDVKPGFQIVSGKHARSYFEIDDPSAPDRD